VVALIKSPSQRRIGARVRIKSEFAESVAAQFATANLPPIYVEHREDGDISFWFDKPTAGNPLFADVLHAIPFEHWAIHAVVGNPTFH
jgi:hypothetical protein